MSKLTKRVIDAELKKSGGDRFLWDSELKGFGVRIGAQGRVAFVVQYRTAHYRTRRFAFAVYGPCTADQAREQARQLLARAHAGEDPSAQRHEAREALTVAQLCSRYLEAARAGLVKTRFGRSKRASTLAIDEGRVTRHIVPLIGGKAAAQLTRADVQRMADAIAAGKTAGTFKTKERGKAVVTGGGGTAARVVELVGGIWTWAERRGHVNGISPVRGVEKHRPVPKDRVMAPDELARLGAVLTSHAERYPEACAVIRLIAVTGLRQSEAVMLRWSEIDPSGACLRLQETKTGRSVRPLGKAASDLLNGIERGSSEYVFGGRELKKQLANVFDAAGLHDARCHDLRRTFASTAAELGYGDATTAELIGHARRGVTQVHYVRRPDSVLIEAATRTGELIDARMTGRQAQVFAFPPAVLV